MVFANQLSLYGAVANMCEEFETHQDRSGQLDVLMGQSIVRSESEAQVLLENGRPNISFFYCSDLKNESNCFHKKTENKFCLDLYVVEIGQYFMTKDTMHRLVVNILFQDRTDHYI